MGRSIVRNLFRNIGPVGLPVVVDVRSILSNVISTDYFL